MKDIAKSVLTCIIFLWFLSPSIYSQSGTYTALLKVEASRDAGDNISSLNLLNEFLSSNSDYRFYILRGEIYLTTGDLVSAESDFISASGIKKGSGSYGLSRVYASGRNAEKALRYLDENLNSDFRVSERVIMADHSFNGIENTAEWRKFWSTDRYNEAELFLSEIQYLIGIGRVEDASEIVSDKKSTFSPGPEMAFSEALLNFSSGKYQAAVDLLSSSASSELPESMRDKLLAESHFKLGNYQQSIELFTDMIEKEVPDAEIFISRANCYVALSEYRQALSDLDFYLSLYPHDNVALNLAGVISTKAGDTNGALKYLNKNLEANPNSIEAFKSRGEIWVSTRMWDYAISDFSMVLDLDPYDSEIWLNKGLSFLNLGKKEEACHDFRQSMRLGNRKASEYINKHCIR